jgi:hypothetical protein
VQGRELQDAVTLAAAKQVGVVRVGHLSAVLSRMSPAAAAAAIS